MPVIVLAVTGRLCARIHRTSEYPVSATAAIAIVADISNDRTRANNVAAWSRALTALHGDVHDKQNHAAQQTAYFLLLRSNREQLGDDEHSDHQHRIDRR